MIALILAIALEVGIDGGLAVRIIELLARGDINNRP